MTNPIIQVTARLKYETWRWLRDQAEIHRSSRGRASVGAVVERIIEEAVSRK